MTPEPNDQLIIEPEVSPFAGPSPPSFEIDADQAFIESDELYFDGQKLNTSARRYIFVTSVADSVEDAPIIFAATMVFACLATNDQIIEWDRDNTAFQKAFGDWIDKIDLVPKNTKTFEEIGKISEKIADGWVGGGNEVDESESGNPQSVISLNGESSSPQ